VIIQKPLPSETYHVNVRLDPKGIILHYISAINTAPSRMFDPDEIVKIFIELKVSAHYLVLRNGDIWQLVRDDRIAWHAGKSQYLDFMNLNSTFLGIEFIGGYDFDFTDEQYIEGANLVASLMQKYQIPTVMVKGHEDVSGPKVRTDYKTDPGPRFDWLRFGGRLHA
jgi:N-acetylmuramoyl-L-alanine amidase